MRAFHTLSCRNSLPRCMLPDDLKEWGLVTDSPKPGGCGAKAVSLLQISILKQEQYKVAQTWRCSINFANAVICRGIFAVRCKLNRVCDWPSKSCCSVWLTWTVLDQKLVCKVKNSYPKYAPPSELFSSFCFAVPRQVLIPLKRGFISCDCAVES